MSATRRCATPTEAGETYFENAGARGHLVKLDHTHEQIGERRCFDVPQEAVDDVRLTLYEGEHLRQGAVFISARGARAQGVRFTSAGFLLRNTAFTLAKYEARAIFVGSLYSSGGFSRTVSQKGVRSWSDRVMQVSTIHHKSLHSTSVAINGYLYSGFICVQCASENIRY